MYRIRGLHNVQDYKGPPDIQEDKGLPDIQRLPDIQEDKGLPDVPVDPAGNDRWAPWGSWYSLGPQWWSSTPYQTPLQPTRRRELD